MTKTLINCKLENYLPFCKDQITSFAIDLHYGGKNLYFRTISLLVYIGILKKLG